MFEHRVWRAGCRALMLLVKCACLVCSCWAWLDGEKRKNMVRRAVVDGSELAGLTPPSPGAEKIPATISALNSANRQTPELETQITGRVYGEHLIEPIPLEKLIVLTQLRPDINPVQMSLRESIAQGELLNQPDV